MKKRKTKAITIGVDLNNDITLEIILIHLSKRGFAFLQITLFVCSLLLKVFTMLCFSAGI